MVEFFEQYQLLVFGLLAVLVILLLFVFLRKPKKAETVEPKKVNVESVKVPEAEPAKVVESKKEVESKPVEPQPVETPKEPVVTEPVKPVVVASEEEEDEGDDDPSKDNVTKDKPAKYHVSQNKDDKNPNYKKWRVRKEGSTKTIKYLETQKEAIEYATDLAEKAGTTIVIHKMDGSIRKQDYTKK